MGNDDSKNGRMTRYQSSPLPAVTPTPSIPSLPSASGALWGSRTTIMRKDAALIQAHTNFLQAQTAQSDALQGLVQSRLSTALTLARLSSLPEIAQHAYDQGRRDRAHEVAMQELHHEIAEINERIQLARVRQAFAALEPVVEKSAPISETGLTPDEVEELLQAMPEISPDTITTLRRLLLGRLKEKRG